MKNNLGYTWDADERRKNGAKESLRENELELRETKHEYCKNCLHKEFSNH